MVKQIELTKGFVTIVDDEDYAHLVLIPWRYNNNGYAITAKTAQPKAMHHYILHIPPNMVADHINRDRLDNRKINLRICTKLENSKNRSKRFNSKSDFRGVSYNNRDKNWAAKIWVDGKNLHLGTFSNDIDAAKAYDEAAAFYYKQFANLNFGDK
jgi:hypothetical protein